MKKLIILITAIIMAAAYVPQAAVETVLTDVAKNKPVYFINGSTKAGALPNINDANADTYWESVAHGWNCICIDLGREYLIKNVRVNIPEAISSQSPAFFTIFLSNNATGGHDAAGDEVIANQQSPAAGEYNYTEENLPDKSYRYVKIQNVSGQTTGFSDIEIMAYEEKINLLNIAQNKPVNINAGATYDGIPMQVNDGDAETYWISQGTFTVLEIDLGKEYDVSEIAVTVPGAVTELGQSSYGLGLSNTKGGQEVAWSTLRTDVTPGDYVHYVSAVEKYRYVKFMTYSSQVYGFSEIKVMVKDPYFSAWRAIKGENIAEQLCDGVDRIEIDITDNRDMPGEFMILTVLYDGTGNLKLCRAAEQIPERGIYTASIDLSDLQFEQGQKLKTALISSLGQMHLFSETLTLEYERQDGSAENLGE